MGYELRKVPASWEHPKNEKGNYIPLFGGSYSKYSKHFDIRREMWNKGFDLSTNIIEGKIVNKWVPKDKDNTDSFEDWWDGEKRTPVDYMPDWTEAELTHFQMYENVTEGTPISPVFEKPEDLAHWLGLNLDNNLYPYTQAEWLVIIKKPDDPSTSLIIPIQT